MTDKITNDDIRCRHDNHDGDFDDNDNKNYGITYKYC